jgi:hypothetical protein
MTFRLRQVARRTTHVESNKQTVSGRPDAARTELALARELDREYVMNHALSAMVEFHAGNMDAAIGHARRGPWPSTPCSG